jgi:mono/diheme cytochrome c family protein
VPSPTPAQFAEVCASCHTARYRALYFDWRRSLDERAASVLAIIKDLRAADRRRADDLAARLAEAQRVGMHNLGAAIRMLDDMRGTTPLR